MDPVHFGAYWAQRKNDFPKHQLKDAVIEEPGPGIFVGPPPLRAWLINDDDTRLIQLQHDRLFVNWRRQRDSDAYPHFQNAREGEPLLPYALREWTAFVAFCRTEHLEPEVRELELTKVDLLVEGRDWKGDDDLAALVPAISALMPASAGARRELAWRYTDTQESGAKLAVSAATGKHLTTSSRVLRIETRVRALASSAEHESTFRQLDEIVDRAFFDLIPRDQLTRFGIEA